MPSAPPQSARPGAARSVRPMGMLCWTKRSTVEEGKTPNDYNTSSRSGTKKTSVLSSAGSQPSVRGCLERRERDPRTSDGTLARELVRFSIRRTPTRPVTAACDNQRAGFDGFQDAVDIFGYNYKPSLYGKFHDAKPVKTSVWK